MLTILFWVIIFSALANLSVYIFRRATYPKQPFVHCPICGGKLPEHIGACTWKPPVKPKPPVGSIILLLLLCVLPSALGILIELWSPPIPPTPIPTATKRPPTSTRRPPTPTQNPCLLWSAVTPRMEGQDVCIYGDIYALYSTYETWTRIKFTDKPNTFFLYSQIYIFPDLSAGECLMAEGTVQLYDGIPYIETDDLYYCE